MATSFSSFCKDLQENQLFEEVIASTSPRVVEGIQHV